MGTRAPLCSPSRAARARQPRWAAAQRPRVPGGGCGNACGRRYVRLGSGTGMWEQVHSAEIIEPAAPAPGIPSKSAFLPELSLSYTQQRGAGALARPRIPPARGCFGVLRQGKEKPTRAPGRPCHLPVPHPGDIPGGRRLVDERGSAGLAVPPLACTDTGVTRDRSPRLGRESPAQGAATARSWHCAVPQPLVATGSPAR